MSRPTTDDLSAEEWAGEMGERWLTHLDRFESMIAPIGRALISRAAFRAPERIIDVGCGGGATSLEIARQVAPGGSVLGVDISPQLVASCERRARAQNVSNVGFQCSDATTVRSDGPRFDRLFSRFGLMFFADAQAAFTNLHTLLREGGRADFCVWAPARENQWIAQVMGIIGQAVQIPPPVPRAPGPFALDDTNYVRELLTRGGFKNIDIDSWIGDQPVGGAGAGPGDAADFVFDAMSLGRVLEDSAPEVRAKTKAAITELFASNHTATGVLMPSKAYFVSAVA